MSPLLQVALGGAIGSALRYGAGLAVVRVVNTGFPVAIITVNILGSFLMGFCLIWLTATGLATWRPFVLTGMLGGFTTFSAFSLETVSLIENGQISSAALYVSGSVLLSVAGLWAGLTLARGIWV